MICYTILNILYSNIILLCHIIFYRLYYIITSYYIILYYVILYYILFDKAALGTPRLHAWGEYLGEPFVVTDALGVSLEHVF